MDELKRLMKAAQITEQLCVDYIELGAEDNRRLCAFLMEGDKDDGIIVCVDEEPMGTDVPSPRLEFIAAAVNALPELIALREAAKEVEAWLASPELESTRYMECSGPGTFYPDRTAMLTKLRAALNQETENG